MNETVVKITKDKLYDQYIEELGSECLVFVSESGKERLSTLDSTFYFIPSNGVKGQVLKKSDSGFFWDDFNSIRNHNSVANLPVDYNTFVIRTGTNRQDENIELHFTGDFVKGQEITLYLTKDEAYTYGFTLKFDKDEYINLNNVYSVNVEDGVWTKLVFFYDGFDMYVDIQTKDVFTAGDQFQSIIANVTNVVKNQYELSVGKHNKSIRETSTRFGAKNSVFTVGNGNSDNDDERHDAFVVCQDGTIQVPLAFNSSGNSYDVDPSSEYYQKPMVCLQNWVNDKLDKPKEDGDKGQFLTKTEDGVEWTTPLTGNYVQEIKQDGGYITYKSTNFRTGNSDENTIDVKTINGQSIFGQGDIKISGGGGGAEFPDGEPGQVLTKTKDGVEFKNLPGTDGISLLRITRDEYNARYEAGTLDETTLYLITG